MSSFSRVGTEVVVILQLWLLGYPNPFHHQQTRIIGVHGFVPATTVVGSGGITNARTLSTALSYEEEVSSEWYTPPPPPASTTANPVNDPSTRVALPPGVTPRVTCIRSPEDFDHFLTPMDKDDRLCVVQFHAAWYVRWLLLLRVVHLTTSTQANYHPPFLRLRRSFIRYSHVLHFGSF
jgi:hypothetical protein